LAPLDLDDTQKNYEIVRLEQDNRFDSSHKEEKMMATRGFRLLNLMLILIMAMGLVLFSCAKKDEDGDNGNGPSGPDDSGIPPADFSGTWFKLAMQEEGEDAVVLSIDPLVRIEVDTLGDWEWYNGQSRVRNGSSTWDVETDTNWIMNTAIVGGEELFREWTVHSYDDDMTELSYTTSDSTGEIETWFFTRGNNKIVGLVNLQFDNSPLAGATVTISSGGTETGSTETTSNGFFIYSELEAGTYSATVAKDGYESQVLAEINVNLNSPSLRGASMTLEGGDYGTLNGTVTNSESGDPLEGAEVRTDAGVTDTTDESGDYSISVAAGSRIVRVYYPGYDLSNDTVVVAPDSEVEHDVSMIWNPEGNEAFIQGTIRDGLYQAPVNSVLIESDDGFSTMTDSVGEYAFTVYAGVRILTISFNRYETRIDTTEELRAGATYERDYLIWFAQSDLTGTVSGRVTDSGTGIGIFGAAISTDLYPEIPEELTSTDESGNFSFEVTIGSRIIAATVDGYDPNSWAVVVVEDQLYEHNFALVIEGGGGERGTVSGYVIDNSDNSAIPNASVFADDGTQTATNVDGYYSMVVTVGNRTITASAAGFEDSNQQVQVESGMNYDINFSLSTQSGQLGTVIGVVTDSATGAPLENARVQSDDNNFDNADASGNYSFTCTPGARTITAMLSGWGARQVQQDVVAGQTHTVNFQLPAASGGNGTNDTLFFENGQANRNWINPGGHMASRLTPDEPCQILELWYATSLEGSSTFNAEVYGWNGTNPTNQTHTQTATALDGVITPVDVRDENLQVDGDFIVSFSAMGQAESPRVLGNADFTNNRCWITDETSGGAWAEFQPFFIIRAVVMYPNGVIATLTPEDKRVSTVIISEPNPVTATVESVLHR